MNKKIFYERIVFCSVFIFFALLSIEFASACTVKYGTHADGCWDSDYGNCCGWIFKGFLLDFLLNSNKVCAVEGPSTCPWPNTDYQTYNYADTKKCPSSGTNGASCDVKDGLFCDKSFTGKWDASENKCVACSNGQESKIYGDSYGIYTDEGGINGNSKCESACSDVDNVCDEKTPGTYLNSCKYGKEYFADKCSDSCKLEDEKICRSSAYGPDCTASTECNGITPGSNVAGGYCDNNCKFVRSIGGGFGIMATIPQKETDVVNGCCNEVDDDQDGNMNGRDSDCQVDKSLSSGTNTVCWWTEWGNYRNGDDFYSGWFSCPSGYYVSSIDIQEKTYSAGAMGFFRIYDENNYELYSTGNLIGQKTIDVFATAKRYPQQVKFRYNNPYQIIETYKVLSITCTPTSPIILYSDINYAGDAIGLSTDDPDLSDNAGPCGSWAPYHWDDCASSIKVKSSYEVRLYDGKNYNSPYIILTANDPDLINNNFNDKISSIRIAPCTCVGPCTSGGTLLCNPVNGQCCIGSSTTTTSTTTSTTTTFQCQPDSCKNLLTLVQNSYGSKCGDSKYDKRADINKDKSVNTLDLTNISLHCDGSYGSWCQARLDDPYDPCVTTTTTSTTTTSTTIPPQKCGSSCGSGEIPDCCCYNGNLYWILNQCPGGYQKQDSPYLCNPYTNCYYDCQTKGYPSGGTIKGDACCCVSGTTTSTTTTIPPCNMVDTSKANELCVDVCKPNNYRYVYCQCNTGQSTCDPNRYSCSNSATNNGPTYDCGVITTSTSTTSSTTTSRTTTISTTTTTTRSSTTSSSTTSSTTTIPTSCNMNDNQKNTWCTQWCKPNSYRYVYCQCDPGQSTCNISLYYCSNSATNNGPTYDCGVITTTTSTTTSSSTTTTSWTTTTSTTIPPGGFIGTNFVCNYIQTNNLWDCYLDYTNNMNQRVIVKFHFVDSVSSEVKSTGSIWTNIGSSGTVGSELSCDNYHGTYYVVWRAFQELDRVNAVGRSISPLTITC